jgi:hypothetical protein
MLAKIILKINIIPQINIRIIMYIKIIINLIWEIKTMTKEEKISMILNRMIIIIGSKILQSKNTVHP